MRTAPGRLALMRLTEIALIAGSMAAAVTSALRGHLVPAATSGILALSLYGFLLNRIRRAHFSWGATCLSLAGLPIFAYLLLRSKLSYKQGSVTWKGRTYISQ